MTLINAELVGYLASALIAISLMMSSILRLRLLNLVGAAAFSVYGFLIGSMPVAVVNLFIVGVNVFYLARILGAKEYFRVLEVRAASAYLQHFLDCTRDDIRRFMPGVAPAARAGDLALFILRGVIPAGVLIGEPGPDGTLKIRVDYVLPQYRDFKIGGYLYGEQAEFFRARGIRRLEAYASTRHHARYLRRMGFRPDAATGKGTWVREV